MQNKDKKTPGTADITMKSELKKVIWPTGKQTLKSTTVTIAFVLLVSVILVLLNLAFDFVSSKYYNAVLDLDSREHQVILSGDDISGDLAEIIEGLSSGDNSGEISGEIATVSGEQAE